MKRQRGIVDGWLIFIGVVVILALLAAIGYGIKSYLDGVDAKAYQRGKQETEAAYAKRDNQALLAANTEIQRLNNEARAAEREGQRRINDIAKQRERDLANAKVQYDRDLSAVRSGNLILRDPGQAAARARERDRSAGPEPAASSGICNADSGGGLSAELAEFLLGEANRADEIVRQLTSAQAVIIEDRRICGGHESSSPNEVRNR